MKKIFFYNFLPTKAEEESAIDCNEPVTRTLVEITDHTHRPPRNNVVYSNPCNIRKYITANEILTGKLSISQGDMFEHVFRYWTLDMANQVVSGNTCSVILIDYTYERRGITYRSQVENGPNSDTYLLGLMDVIRKLQLNPGDEIGLFWDRNSGTFGFKLYIASRKLRLSN